MNETNRSASWSAGRSAELYGIEDWGQGYFSVSPNGRLLVRPEGEGEGEIDLLDVVEGLGERDLSPPLLIRFSDILAHRLKTLREAFAIAIAENDYRGSYLAAYPIKVNQQRPVVEEIFRYGTEYDFGLEVGSKPELLAVMALTGGSSERLIVCNGFKDDGYIEAAILAAKLGRRIVPIVEDFGEVRLILKHALKHEVVPSIGVRVKLASQGAGRWKGSAGEKSKFGLFVSEILQMVELLSAHDMLGALQLVHCHPGSQIHDIDRLKDAIGELGHVYAELIRLGAPLQYVDVGGGLGVDYDGSRTSSESSMNYTLEEYAREVVYRLGSVCDECEVPHPTIVSESGRAIAAYQTVLVFNVLGSAGPRTTYPDPFPVPAGLTRREDVPQPIRDLVFAYEAVDEGRLVECYHDAARAREEALNLFNLGYLTLELRGLAEQLFWATCARVQDRSRELDEVPEELDSLDEILSETYFCNFSVFQSLPDAWAIDQVFPIMPIHRLEEEPTRRAVLADVTCDSDGKIDRFVDGHSTIELHELDSESEYYLGVFLVGAYQEALGDLHNLFGDTHVIHVRLHEEGGWWIEEVVEGDTAREVLGYMQYDAERLQPLLARDCELAVREGRMTVADTRMLMRFYHAELSGYTYLEADG
ncbi:MAG: biosynthetic arginine decarboxylase [Candidatus Palauibacterales bacterium]|jgi:arginine decarboxylase|nr:biosynthetic arginine decarboxylase [Candidatus Palauibacterales bacterium]